MPEPFVAGSAKPAIEMCYGEMLLCTHTHSVQDRKLAQWSNIKTYSSRRNNVTIGSAGSSLSPRSSLNTTRTLCYTVHVDVLYRHAYVA